MLLVFRYNFVSSSVGIQNPIAKGLFEAICRNLNFDWSSVNFNSLNSLSMSLSILMSCYLLIFLVTHKGSNPNMISEVVRWSYLIDLRMAARRIII